MKRAQPKPILRPDLEFAEALTEARGYVAAALAALDGVALDGKMAPGVDNDPDIERARQRIRDAIVPSNLIAAQLWRAIRALDAEQHRRWAAAPPISAEELQRCIRAAAGREQHRRSFLPALRQGLHAVPLAPEPRTARSVPG